MSKSKSWQRKLKRPHQGMRYYRIWGTPLEDWQVPYHQENYGYRADLAIIQSPVLGWLRLDLEEEVVANSSYRDTLNGSLTPRMYFRRKHQGIKVLGEYLQGIRTEGLAELCDYHFELEMMELLSRDDFTKGSL